MAKKTVAEDVTRVQEPELDTLNPTVAPESESAMPNFFKRYLEHLSPREARSLNSYLDMMGDAGATEIQTHLSVFHTAHLDQPNIANTPRVEVPSDTEPQP